MTTFNYIEEVDGYERAMARGGRFVMKELTLRDKQELRDLFDEVEEEKANQRRINAGDAIVKRSWGIPDHPRESARDREIGEGKDLTEAEILELEGMSISPAIDYFLSETLPARAADFATAAALVDHLQKTGYRVFLRHGVVKVEPKPPESISQRVYDLMGPIGEVLDLCEHGKRESLNA